MDFTYNWAHNLFVLWALGFLQWGVLRLKTQSLTLVFTTPSLSHKATSLSFGMVPLLSSCLLLRVFSHPLNFSSQSLFYSVRSVGVSWLFLIISGNVGPIPLCLSGCFVGSGSSGIGTGFHLRNDVWQRYSLRLYWAAETCIPKQSHSCLGCKCPSKARIVPRGVWAKIAGPTCLRSRITARGLGPWLSGPGALPRTRGQGQGSYHWAGVKGLMGSGIPYHTTTFIKNKKLHNLKLRLHKLGLQIAQSKPNLHTSLENLGLQITIWLKALC